MGHVPLLYCSPATWNQQKNGAISFVWADNYLMLARQLISKPAHILLVVLRIHIYIPDRPPPHPRPANADLLGSTAQGSMLLTNSPGDPYSQQLKNLWCQDWYNRKHFTLPWNAFPAYPLPFTTCLAYACSDRTVDLACNCRIFL